MMTGEDLKNSILQMAMQGKLVEQRAEEGTGGELLKEITAEKNRLIREGKIKKQKKLPPITEDEIPFEIPESWVWVRLGNLISIKSGEGLTASQMIPGNIPVYGGNGITGYHNQALVHKKTVVIGRVGFYCGSVLVTEKEAWITDNAFITTYPEKCIDRGFLVYVLRHMNLGQNNNATAQPVVSGKKIYPRLVPLPPLAEQKRIVARIEELMPFVNAYSASSNKLTFLNTSFPSDLKKSILQQAVEGKLVPQDPNDEPASVLLEKIRQEKDRLIKEGKIKKQKKLAPIREDEIPFDIPKSWEWCRLGNLLDDVSDGTHLRPHYTEKGVPFISVKDIHEGRISFDDCKYVSEEDAKKLNSRCNPCRGDMLITKVGSNTGIPAVVDTDIFFSLFVSVALLKYNHKYLYQDYLYYLLMSPLVQNQCDACTRGVGNPNWVLRDIMNTIVSVPPFEEQGRITKRIKALIPDTNRMISILGIEQSGSLHLR